MASNPIILSRRQSLWGRIIARLCRDLGAWLYVALVLGLVSVLAFVYLAQASYVARQIDLMVELEDMLDVLHEENSVLLLRIARYEEMPRIKAEARAMGLGDATHVEYVEVVLDDAGPAARGGMVQSSPTSRVNGGQSQVTSEGVGVLSPEGLRFVSAIAQQFQSWISGSTAGRGAEQSRWNGTQ